MEYVFVGCSSYRMSVKGSMSLLVYREESMISIPVLIV